MKTLILLGLGVALLLAGAVAGTLYASGFWGDDEVAVDITPTRPKAERFLTAGEAAAKASAATQGVATCKTDSYNENSKNWIVVCTVSGPQNTLESWYAVNDWSRVVSPIR